MCSLALFSMFPHFHLLHVSIFSCSVNLSAAMCFRVAASWAPSSQPRDHPFGWSYRYRKIGISSYTWPVSSTVVKRRVGTCPPPCGLSPSVDLKKVVVHERSYWSTFALRCNVIHLVQGVSERSTSVRSVLWIEYRMILTDHAGLEFI